MAERTLSIVVEGEDRAASAVLINVGGQVIKLGADCAALNPQLAQLAQVTTTVGSAAGAAASGLGALSTGAQSAGSQAVGAGIGLTSLTTGMRMVAYSAGISRRSLMMVTGAIRLLGASSGSAGVGVSGAGMAILGVGAAAVVAGAVIGRIVGLLTTLATKSIEVDEKRVDFEKWAADAGGHEAVLGKLREVTGGLTSDIDLQSDATAEMARRTAEWMVADESLTTAQARRLAFMGYDRDLIQETIRRGDRLGDSYRKMETDVANLGDSIGQKFTPALDTVGDSTSDLVTRVEPALGSLTDTAATWFSGLVQKADPAVAMLGDIVTVFGTLARLTLTPFKFRLEFIRQEILSPISDYLSQSGWGSPPVSPTLPSALLPPGPERAAFSELTVHGHISVDVNVSGDLPRVGHEIGQGILSELRSVGLA